VTRDWLCAAHGANFRAMPFNLGRDGAEFGERAM
jgi:hypothetical protein